MTHRSRSGGPQRQRPGQKKKQAARKLHHPPPLPVAEEEDDQPSALPASVFTSSPSDDDILKLVHHALRTCLDSPYFNATVQKVKGLLYDKKWLEVFTDPELLESYAGRWVPSRACCYRELFAHLGPVRELFIRESDQVTSGNQDEEDQLDEEDEERSEKDEERSGENEQNSVNGGGDNHKAEEPETEQLTNSTDHVQPPRQYNILSLGGGASSELLGVAAMARASLDHLVASSSDRKGESPAHWNWTGVDIGAWSSVVNKFKRSLVEEWELDDSVLHVEFIQGGLLASAPPAGEFTTSSTCSIPPIDVARLLANKRPALTTILFTLTELMCQSRSSTISLLRTLTAHTPKGGFLLVADSASDISEFEMGSSGRKWPIYMILDTILLGPPAPPGVGPRQGEWECVRKEDSRWYRLPAGVGAGWPVKLENTRYWYRLYRRV